MGKTIHKSSNITAPTSAFDLFGKSSTAVQRNLSTFVILNLLPAATMIGGAISQSRHSNQANDFNGFGALSGLPTYAIASLAGFGIIVFIAVVIAGFIIRAMLYSLQLQAAKDKNPDLSALWQVGKKYWLRLLGLNIVVGLVIIGGFLLLIVPGLIMIRRYFLSPYILVDKDTTIGEAMRRSAELSKPYSGSIWGIIGVSILISIPSFVPFVGQIISFVLNILYSVAPALRYEELKKLAKA